MRSSAFAPDIDTIEREKHGLLAQKSPKQLEMLGAFLLTIYGSTWQSVSEHAPRKRVLGSFTLAVEPDFGMVQNR